MGGDLAHRLPPLPAIQARAAQPGAPVPLVIAAVAYDRPSAAAVGAAMQAAPTGGSADLPTDLALLLEPATTTIATVLLADQWNRATPAVRGRNLRLVLDPALLITNLDGASIGEVAVDAGGGYRAFDAGGTLDLEVPPDVSALTITVRCSVAGHPRYAACTLAISDDPVPPPPDETWTLTPATGNPGHAFVFRSGAGDRLSRPVLIAEGFPGGASPEKLAETLGQCGLLGRLRALGHDVVAVGFDKGRDTIQSNAGVIREAIARARSRTDDPLVVGGMSMGGLVARYALAAMESEGVDHGTCVYLSVDSPHGRGAYTTVVGQWLVSNFTGLSPAFAGLVATIRSSANLQFIGLIESGGTVGPDPLRTAFLDDLQRVGGYPSKLVKLALACGHGAGNTEPAPTEPVLRWFSEGIADVTLLPMPAGTTAQIATGATLGVPTAPPPLVVTSEVCWEQVPGALNVLNAEAIEVVRSLGCTSTTDLFTSTLGISSSMPTVSVLDADVGPNDPIPPPGSGVSPFDDYCCAATNLMHLQLTDEMVDWLIDRLEAHQPATPPRQAARSDSTAPPRSTTRGTPVSPHPTSPGGLAPPPVGSIDPTTFDPNDPAFVADPYPTFAWFREHLPVAPISLVPGKVPPSTWVFANADVQRVLEETDTFLKHAGGPGAPPSMPPPAVFATLGALPPGLLSSDPPRHSAVRVAVEPSFTAAIADAAALARHAVDQTLAVLSRTRRIELVQDFALPVPAMVLAQVLGLPANDITVLTNWVEAVATMHNITQPPSVQGMGATCAMAMRTYYDGLIVANGVQPGGGMLSGVCEHVDKGLDRRDVQSIMSDMLIAGFLTTTYLISTGIRTLLANPDQAADLRADPSLIPAAVEEMLRFDPPAQLLDRQVHVPTTLGGVALQPGARVVASIGSANRDALVYADPDRFDIHRTDTSQLGFGAGIHHCIGAPLARIVVPAAIEGLLSLDDLRINGIEQWQPDPYLRGLTSLPMAYGA